MEDSVVYESTKTTAYLVLTLITTLAALNILAFYEIIPTFIEIPSDVFIFGTASLTALVLAFLIFDREYSWS